MVRIGIIGIGNMGSAHAVRIYKGQIEGLRLVAVCDIAPAKLEWAEKELPGVARFGDAQACLDSGLLDAVLIATPHYFHPTIAMQAFERGLHVLTEKPAGVYTGQVIAMNEAAKKAGTVFGIMYNQRTYPLYRTLKTMIEEGKLGRLTRLSWLITNWYRTQSYYDSGSWRATWGGEGGGVLINQCPHNLDIWQWLFGLPDEIHGFVSEGKHHRIEVEDEVTAYASYKDGRTATFVTTTGECPGTNRLEICGELGKVVVENGVLTHYELSESSKEFSVRCKDGFSSPQVTVHTVKAEDDGPAHNGILQNFTNAILHGEPLIAPGLEGIRGLEISNAIHLSGWTGKTVSLPVDPKLYEEKLREKIETSAFQGGVSATVPVTQGKDSPRWLVR